ncbi:MAG TPA: MurR/RpiR family transcriptional regulator [Streptosporangiaceae bacterium]|nr:MurR/RpiR family transcriptional regulator [Streptosporangiaceae bacterium]
MHTPQTLLAHVRALTPNLAPAEQRVAAAVVSDPGGVAAKTISELAESCRTSGTTVIRFCRAMGFPGYPELRLALAAAAQAGRAVGWGNIGSDIGPHDTLDEIVKKIAHADARAVEETAAQLDAGTLAEVVDAVVGARRIDIYGIGASAFVALDLQQKLHRIERIVYAWPDPHSAVTSAALLRRGDVAIGISHTGTTADTVGSLTEARSRGAATVAITNFPRSSIARAADYVLTTAARETTFRSGAMASRIAALTVVDCLFVAVAQRNYKQTLRALERTYAAVQARR